MWMAILKPKLSENTPKTFRKTHKKQLTENEKNTKYPHIS